jgi:hypothetical protein
MSRKFKVATSIVKISISDIKEAWTAILPEVKGARSLEISNPTQYHYEISMDGKTAIGIVEPYSGKIFDTELNNIPLFQLLFMRRAIPDKKRSDELMFVMFHEIEE